MRTEFWGLLMLLYGIGAMAADLAPISLGNDWPVRNLPDEPPIEVIVATRVVWTVECGEHTEPLVGRIQHAASGQEGRIYLADSQLGHILQISPPGDIEALRGRVGEGPGEFKGLYRVVELPDRRLGGVGGAPAPSYIIGARGELVFINQSDDLAGTWMIGGDPGSVPTTAVRDLRQAGGLLLVVTNRSIVSPPKMTQVRELSLLAAPDGARAVLIRQLWTTEMDDTSWHEEDQFESLAYGRCDLAPDGRVAFAPERDRWLVAVGDPLGAGEIWQRSLVGVQRTAIEREAAREDLGVRDLSQTCDRNPVIRQVRWRSDGRLWVEPWGITPQSGCIVCFDEFSAEGRLLRRIHLAADVQPEHGHLELLNDGRFVWYEGFEWHDDTFVGEPRVYLLEVAEPGNRGS